MNEITVKTQVGSTISLIDGISFLSQPQPKRTTIKIAIGHYPSAL